MGHHTLQSGESYHVGPGGMGGPMPPPGHHQQPQHHARLPRTSSVARSNSLRSSSPPARMAMPSSNQGGRRGPPQPTLHEGEVLRQGHPLAGPQHHQWVQGQPPVHAKHYNNGGEPIMAMHHQHQRWSDHKMLPPPPGSGGHHQIPQEVCMLMIYGHINSKVF